MRMLAQILLNAFAECAGPFAVHDTDRLQMREISIVQIFVQLLYGIINSSP